MLKNNKVFLAVLCLMIFPGFMVIAEESRYLKPGNFNQSPMLDKLVKDGELPPVEERVPDDPYVVKVNEKIGSYGGTLHTATLSNPNSWGDDHMIMDLGIGFTKPDADGSKIVRNFSRGFSSTTDKSVWTFKLRRDVKWSDGKPFTTEDIMFWYNNILLNKELTPAVKAYWKAGGEIVKVRSLDDYTIQFEFAAPRPFFANRFAQQGYELYQPKHYLKQFHPEYIDREELQKKVEEAGFDYWYELFNDRNMTIRSVPLVVGRPTLTSYILVEKTPSRRVYERNPYFWKVDTVGNQLPYIDRIETEVVSDVEDLNGMIMNGKLDFAAHETDIRNYPMYKQYEKEGGYKTYLWRSGYSSEVVYMFNMTHKDPQLRDLFSNVKFRRAMSLSINRDEINDAIYFGKAVPGQFTVLPSSHYYEPEFAEAYAEYDPERAKDLLDEIGVKDVDGDDWRELPGGDNLSITLEYTIGETVKEPNIELVVNNWRNIGININVKQSSFELRDERGRANLIDASIWHGDKATDVLFPSQPQPFVPSAINGQMIAWHPWARWFVTNGDVGEEPPAEMKKLYTWLQKMYCNISDEERIKLGKKILRAQAENLWSIGTVGQSPWPVIANDKLHNIPENVIWVWDTMWSTTRDPEQIFFEDSSR